jgi:hypothetical protein
VDLKGDACGREKMRARRDLKRVEKLSKCLYTSNICTHRHSYTYSIASLAPLYLDMAIMVFLHDFLWCMLSEQPLSAMVKISGCWMMKIIMIVQIRKDLRLKQPESYSGSVASFQWCARGVFLREIIRRGDGNKVDGTANYVRQVFLG